MLQELEGFLLAADGAKFSIPELNVLKQRYSDYCSWVNRAKNILGKLYARSDYHNVVEELTGILKEAELLGVKGMLKYHPTTPHPPPPPPPASLSRFPLS